MELNFFSLKSKFDLNLDPNIKRGPTRAMVSTRVTVSTCVMVSTCLKYHHRTSKRNKSYPPETVHSLNSKFYLDLLTKKSSSSGHGH